MIRSSVDLPQPDGPMSDTNWPCVMERSMPLSATVAAPPRTGNALSRPEMRTAGPSLARAVRRGLRCHAAAARRPRSATTSATRTSR